MKRILKNIILVILLFASVISIQAQISPGKLAEAHKHLEGLSNCLKCHELGAKISESKCLECHKTLNQRITAKKGYHSSKEVTGKECASCHSDHHGRNFRIVNFDTNTFDHTLSGYKLEGKHQEVDCRECHTADNIKNQVLAKNVNTFLGLDQKCAACHDDVHRDQLGNDCARCHTQESFETASLFDHEKAKFSLIGQHKNVDCQSCHPITYSNGEKFQEFKDIQFSSCVDCHNDVHSNSLGSDCTQCHSESSFHTLNRKFRHNKTGFALKGAHARIDCKLCHDNRSDLKHLFSEFSNVADHDCKNCHEDVHENRFGNNCIECHNTNSFTVEIDPNQFDHSRTTFTLKGLHNTVDCKECHVADLTDPLPHNECKSCHSNYHKEQFSLLNNDKDCKACHSEDGFSPSYYSIEDHSKNRFPLKGAHIATPCILCHQNDSDTWEFKDIGLLCTSCHENVHQTTLDTKYYPENQCKNCHEENAWNIINFDHSLTSFKLEGKHLATSCSSCHTADDSFKGPNFKIESYCASCHDDTHRGQFGDQELFTDCNQCHKPSTWEEVEFDHNTTRFPLDGAHQNLACGDCHYEINDEKGDFKLYKLETLECIDCH